MKYEELKALHNVRSRKRPSHEESGLQISCVNWFRLQYPNHVLFACPNGGFRNAREAGILKAEGVMPGVADLFLMYAAHGYHGLFIEMKTETGKLSDYQMKFREKCRGLRYDYIICRSFADFIKIVNIYLG